MAHRLLNESGNREGIGPAITQSAGTHAAPDAASPFTRQQTLINKGKWNDYRNNFAHCVDPAAARRVPFVAAQPQLGLRSERYPGRGRGRCDRAAAHGTVVGFISRPVREPPTFGADAKPTSLKRGGAS